MLNLAAPTRAGWVSEAIGALDEVLIDHAHCEKKAASVAVGFLFRYPEQAALLAPLSALAREELTHFELLLGVLGRRGLAYRRQHPAQYGGLLLKAVRPDEPLQLLDRMLCAALIEARSCERMKLLSEALAAGPGADPELARLYAGLLASEARHHNLYVELAAQLFPREDVRARLRELAAHEAAILAEPGPHPRMHS